MCKTDFQYELDPVSASCMVYPSLEAMKKHCKCYEECGIVKVKITLEDNVLPQSLKRYKSEDL